MTPHDTLLAAIRARLAEKSPLLVALDGRCAAGKTTLARALGREQGWSVVPMDHFFLRPEQRTLQRLARPGENVDHERFLTEVLRPLSEGRPAEYRPYNCHALAFEPPVRVEPGPVTIIEGSYACHPSLWDFYDLRVFLTLGPAQQLRRVEARDGPNGLAAFRDKWIPLEEAYFAAFRLEARCDLVLRTDE